MIFSVHDHGSYKITKLVQDEMGWDVIYQNEYLMDEK